MSQEARGPLGTAASSTGTRSVASNSTATQRAFQASFVANLKTDDFVALCEQVRQLCGVDLAQYKRNQMERRVRTWTDRRGTPDLVEYARRLRREPAELEAFLDRVTSAAG
jgi:chemotaxis protein methyltransferase CheR